MKLHVVAFAILGMLGVSCKENDDDTKLRNKANELAQKFILADSHVDLPYRLRIKHFRLERRISRDTCKYTGRRF